MERSKYFLLPVFQDRGGQNKMFLKTVNERGGELLIHSVLLSNKNEPN